MATLLEIAGWVGAESPAVGSEVLRVSSIEAAAVDSIVFAMDAGTLVRALESPAVAVLANVRMRTEESATNGRVIWVPDPRYAFAVVAKRLAGKIARGDIHASVVLGAGVTLGTGTQVGPGVVIEDGVTVGRECVLGPRVTIHAGTVLGDRVVVQAGAVLGSTGFGYAVNRETGEYLLFPQQGTLSIEDDVEIGANTTIDRGALGETRIGRGTKIDNLVHIGHNCLIGRNVIIAAQTGISGSSVVEDGAILGGQVGIGEHATVGAGVILGGGAGVLSGKKMRGPGEVFWGRPARPLKEYLRDLARLKHR
ncbi:MAG: UDP-3-O-(3-hydroxymyristoyl)glucosamine N-acyltransferase [Acidobacteriaceae bacterium]|nr:UDP-3-O-(3-hydroxymyristoyl)glucosamine N-acyltransferase [Acidobacteriaceae bacterium]